MSTTKHLNAVIPSGSADLGRPLAEPESGAAVVETVIRARTGWIAINWDELIQSHELFYALISRDLMVRYKQTVLGVAWAVIQPLISMAVFTIIFGRFAAIKTPVPYALWSLRGPGSLDCSSPTR